MKKLRDRPDSGSSFNGNISPRKTCALGRSAQDKHPNTSTAIITAPFVVVSTNLAGAFKPNATDGSQYISKLTDHHTRWKAAYSNIRFKDKAIGFIEDSAIPLSGLKLGHASYVVIKKCTAEKYSVNFTPLEDLCHVQHSPC